MKVAILTTETLHHTYFIESLLKNGLQLKVFIETKPQCSPPFESWHPYESSRDAYESELWFEGKQSIKIEQITNPLKFVSLNDQAAVNAIADYDADIGFVFGTGKLKEQLIKVGPRHLLNLHGGDPRGYRGLDSHLWAIYHSDYQSLITTLHYVDSNLDTGPIVMQCQISMNKALRLHKLRSINTELCIKMALIAIHSLEALDWLPSTNQQKMGRYYSSMSAELKDVCYRKLEHLANNFKE